MQTQIGGLSLKNPVLTASGTFGYGEELGGWLDLSRLGGLVCKTVTRLPRAGNAPPRTCETSSGMLNAIGLQNIGVERFISEKMPFLRECGVPVVVNIAGETADEFAELAARLSDVPGVAALELNISCPNVAHGLDFAVDPRLTETVVVGARAATALPLWAKLSPNVTDIALIARAAESGGADAICATNTFVGLSIDVRRRAPRLSNGTGGLSGPAIKPLALRAVHRCAQAVKIPVVGIGGIMSAQDALEFLIAGASAIQVGTGTFVQPDLAIQIADGISTYLDEQGITNLSEIVGSLQM